MNLKKNILIGDLVKFQDEHFIIIKKNEDTMPEILTGVSIEHSYELNFTIDDITQ